MTPWTLLLLAGGLAPAGVAAPAVSAPAGAHCVIGVRPRAWRPAAALPDASMGLRIDLDPEAAKPGPHRVAEAAALERDRALAALRPEVLADGSLRLLVGDLLHSYSVLRLDAAGLPHVDCAHERQDADRIARQPLTEDK